METKHPQLSAATLLEREAEVVSGVYSRYTDLMVDRADGAHLYTVDGRDVLDFGCGIAVTNLGHRHPTVVKAVHEQVDKLWHVSVTAHHPMFVEAAEALVSIAPPGLDTVFLNNSGAEAVETALKLARRATGRTDIIAFRGAFHGRTFGALSATASKAKYRDGIGPFLPGVHHVPYPYCFRTCTHGPNEPCPIARGDALRDLFASVVKPNNVAAIIVEPILGEGGYVVPPRDFLPNLRAICDEYGILLIADEVQSGFARSGRMFAVDHWNVVPDIMCVAKAFANGLPIGGIIAKGPLMRAWNKGEHGTTFGGNALACAAAVAVIDVIKKDKLDERATKLGAQVIAKAKEWQKEFPILADIRGRGLMIGLEFDENGEPATAFVEDVRRAAVEHGLLLLTCGTYDNVIRLIPPLTISEDELNTGLEILELCIRECAK